MFAPAFARWLSLAALGVACGCAAPSPDDTASPAGEARDEPTAEVRSALGNFIWTRAASKGASHDGLAAVPLEDGRIFVTGGNGDKALPEIYDARADTWTAVAEPPHGQGYAAAALLPGNRVFVLSDAGFAPDIYDVELDAWSQGAPATVDRESPIAIPLEDGRVLLAGREWSRDVTSVDVFDPVDLTFVSVGALSVPRFRFTATRLLDGRVLFVGGSPSPAGQSFEETEIFDPKTGVISPGGSLPAHPWGHSAVLLPKSGEVLVFGGSIPSEDNWELMADAWVYDPTSAKWTAVDGPQVPAPEWVAAYMPLLGRVIATASYEGHVESFDPASKHWQPMAPMLSPRDDHRLVLLPQGWLLAVGGHSDAQAELVSTEVFGPLGTPCESKAGCGSGMRCVDGVCCATACDGECSTCARPVSLGRCRLQLPGQDLRGECDEGCNGACNGKGQCAFTPVGEPCNPPRCSEDATRLLAPSVCGEDLTCVDPSPNPVECAPYRCGPVDGRPACKARCDSLSDCAPGHVCDLQGRCVPPPPLEPPASCSAAPTSGERGTRVLWAAGLFVLVALGRRRARGKRQAAASLVCALGLSACAAPDITKEADEPLSSRPAGDPTSFAEATWHYVTSPGVLRDKAALVTLPDGSVLVIGGCRRERNYRLCTPTPLVDRFDPVRRQWELQPDLPYAVESTHAVLLNDGRVLVAGGKVDGTAVAAAVVRDPETGMWASLPSMEHARAFHAMVRLLDGRVLVAGGVDESLAAQASVEIFDPSSGGWSAAPPMAHAREIARATLLDGAVFVAGAAYIQGGEDPMPDDASAVVERFDPTSQAWSSLPPMGQIRWAPDIVALQDGRLLVLGGLPHFALDFHKAFAEVFDPRDSMWTPVKEGEVSPHEYFVSMLLPGGQVLVARGQKSNTLLFDPATMAMRPAASTLETHASEGYAALIPGHGVLLFDSQPPELYTALGAPCAAETDCLGSLCVGGTCCSPGCECGTCSPAGCSLVGAPEKKGLSICEPSCVGATRERRSLPCDIHSPECLYEETDCVAYRCDPAIGGCRTDCDGPADCADGFACTVERRCVVPPAPASPASCSAAPRAPGGAATELLATFTLAAACTLRGRRGVRRGAARERERGSQGRPKSRVQ